MLPSFEIDECTRYNLYYNQTEFRSFALKVQIICLHVWCHIYGYNKYGNISVDKWVTFKHNLNLTTLQEVLSGVTYYQFSLLWCALLKFIQVIIHATWRWALAAEKKVSSDLSSDGGFLRASVIELHCHSIARIYVNKEFSSHYVEREIFMHKES